MFGALGSDRRDRDRDRDTFFKVYIYNIRLQIEGCMVYASISPEATDAVTGAILLSKYKSKVNIVGKYNIVFLIDERTNEPTNERTNEHTNDI